MSVRGTALVDIVTKLGAVLAVASAAAYACGFLVRAARARALGTELSLTLVDQAYVYAGFRFAQITMLVLILVLPIAFGFGVIFRYIEGKLSGRLIYTLECCIAVISALLIWACLSMTLRVSGILFVKPGSGLFPLHLCEAVLGRSAISLPLTVAGTALAVSLVMWVRARYMTVGTDALTILIGVMAILQATVLPIQFGVFYADRTARKLERPPDGLKNATMPLWIIDQGSSKAAVLTSDAEGRYRVITVRADSLDGIAVTDSVELDRVVGSGDRSPCAGPSSGSG